MMGGMATRSLAMHKTMGGTDKRVRELGGGKYRQTPA